MFFTMLPTIFALFFTGLNTQAVMSAQNMPGAGPVGRMNTLAQSSAQLGMVFGTACINAAAAQPGVVGNFVVAMPAGVVTPANAQCQATAIAGGGRNVYASLLDQPGMAGNIQLATQQNAAWWRVSAVGQAANLVNNQASGIPVNIPAGSLLDWVQVSP